MTPRSTPKSTSPAPVATGTVATPRAAFTAAAFAYLRAAAGDGQGEALRIPLAELEARLGATDGYATAEAGADPEALA